MSVLSFLFPKYASVAACTLFLFLSPLLAPSHVRSQLIEEERLEEYERRGYSWPSPHYVPDTPGWRALMERRFEQLVSTVPSDHDRYNHFVATMTSALVAQNFTENGWGLTRCPETIRRELVEALHDGLADSPREEVNVDVIEKFGDAATPLFVHNYRLNRKVLSTLRTMHEEWAGVPLVEEVSYGLRVYRNNSNLLMHVDRPVTHIISSILHIDHSEDSEPWPIVIEDFQGNTNEVVLESGDMLFYESSKCLHGRPKTFKGSWYSSIFTHYSPVGWDKANKEMDSHYAVPSVWNKMVPNVHNVEDLAVVGTSIKEPQCKDLWCALRDSVKWSGPSEMGSLLTTGGERTPIQVPEVRPGWDYYAPPPHAISRGIANELPHLDDDENDEAYDEAYDDMNDDMYDGMNDGMNDGMHDGMYDAMDDGMNDGMDDDIYNLEEKYSDEIYNEEL